jgi:hypothetical protein
VLVLGISSLVLALLLTGLAGWRRTAALRAGELPRPCGRGWRASSSRTTWLAAGAGALGLGLAGAADWAPTVRAGAALASGFVLGSGVAARVTGIAPCPGGVLVRRAMLPDRPALVADVREVVPPAWPLGAWRVLGSGRPVSLMPSDLLGAEGALELVVAGAGLRFDDGRWRRPGPGV